MNTLEKREKLLKIISNLTISATSVLLLFTGVFAGLAIDWNITLEVLFYVFGGTAVLLSLIVFITLIKFITTKAYFLDEKNLGKHIKISSICSAVSMGLIVILNICFSTLTSFEFGGPVFYGTGYSVVIVGLVSNYLYYREHKKHYKNTSKSVLSSSISILVGVILNLLTFVSLDSSGILIFQVFAGYFFYFLMVLSGLYISFIQFRDYMVENGKPNNKKYKGLLISGIILIAIGYLPNLLVYGYFEDIYIDWIVYFNPLPLFVIVGIILLYLSFIYKDESDESKFTIRFVEISLVSIIGVSLIIKSLFIFLELGTSLFSPCFVVVGTLLIFDLLNNKGFKNSVKTAAVFLIVFAICECALFIYEMLMMFPNIAAIFTSFVFNVSIIVASTFMLIGNNSEKENEELPSSPETKNS